MSILSKAASTALLIAISAQAMAAEWQLQGERVGEKLTLTYALGEPVSYRFECTPSMVLVTETGVTKLMDFSTGVTVDDEATVLPSGAAMMALHGGKGEPKFVPAEASKNPAGGWDLTIRLPKDHKQLKAMGNSEMVSLFTSGYTMAVAMDEQDRATWKDFMMRCNAIT